MAGRIRMIEGYAHTSDMALAHGACLRCNGVTLRTYLLGWRDAHPSESFEVLAAEFGRHLSTLYRWFDRLEIAPGGPVLRDLTVERSALQATGTDG